MGLFSRSPKTVKYTLSGRGLTLPVMKVGGELWLTQRQLAEIFRLSIPTVNEHLKKIFRTRGFSEENLIKQIEIISSDGKKYRVNHYRREVMDELARRVRR